MENRRFTFVPVLATMLKVVAVLLLAFFLYQAIPDLINTMKGWKGGMPQPPYGMPGPAIKGFLPRLESLIRPLSTLVFGVLMPSLVWGAAEFVSLIRAIEFNTRREVAIQAKSPVAAE